MNILQEIIKYKRFVITTIGLSILVIIFLLITFIYPDKNKTFGSKLDLNLKKKSNEVVNDCNIFVDVSGAVNKPSVYCFNEGDRVVDALKRAGGYVKGKNAKEYIQSSINLARPLVANEKLYFPFRNESSCTSMEYILVPIKKDEVSVTNPKCISINEGSIKDLDSLTGVGPSTAQKIIDARPYKSLDELKNVSGIGDQLFEKLASDICL